jgi:hypothetical protein
MFGLLCLAGFCRSACMGVGFVSSSQFYYALEYDSLVIVVLVL